jgi:hypothetical protein
MQKFMVGAGIGGPPAQRTAPPSPEMVETFARMQGNVDYFLLHGFRPVGSYVPDVSALRAGPTRIVVGVGETSAGTLPFRSAMALAELLGTIPAVFPGGHGGYTDNPEAFAEKMHETLCGTQLTSTNS